MKIENHGQLDVYKMAFDAAVEIFECSKSFPAEEKYSLTDQIRTILNMIILSAKWSECETSPANGLSDDPAPLVRLHLRTSAILLLTRSPFLFFTLSPCLLLTLPVDRMFENEQNLERK